MAGDLANRPTFWRSWSIPRILRLVSLDLPRLRISSIGLSMRVDTNLIVRAISATDGAPDAAFAPAFGHARRDDHETYQ